MRTTLLLIIIFIFIGCASSPPPQKSNLTFAVVKTKVTKGVTTQAEILNILGSPNIITKNSDGNEVWNYARQSFDAESGSYGGGLFVLKAIGGAAYGSKAFSSTSSATFDLILTFDKNDVVQNYTVITSQF